ncbi:MAG: ABC transporter substrate-binding protein, partial [Pseudomonadota bacterium]
DLVAARRLLSEAGLSGGIDLECRVLDLWQDDIALAEALAAQLAEVGVRMTPRLMNGREFWPGWLTHHFSLTPWTQRWLGSMTLGLGYRTGAAWNESSYSNPKFDELLTRADGMVDPRARQSVMAELQKLLQEDGPLIQPAWRHSWYAWDKRLTGFRPHSDPQLDLDQYALVS